MMADNACTRILFSRIPVPGTVKTRLSPYLSSDQCAALQDALTKDLVVKLLQTGDAMVFCYSDEANPDVSVPRYCKELIDHLNLDAGRIVTCPQRGFGLGERMANAFADAFEAGAESCLIMGSDLPYVTSFDIISAERLIDDADVVFGPSSDGGFWLVGMKQPFPELFEDERYGTGDVLARALALCAKHGKSVAFAPPSPDIDTIDDFKRLAERVQANDPRIGHHTAEIVRKVVSH